MSCLREYKANRPPMPNDLRSQIEPLLAIIQAQGLPILRIEGVEADDVIGTLACRASKAGKSVLISTGDKDMAQLVDGSITLINTMSNSMLDRAGVKAKFDVFPEQIIDYLALVGDSSDNIPGIEKVGPKTAAKWLNQYQTLDNLVANAAQITGKVGENLRAGLQTLELSRKLATIHTDLELPLAHDQLTPTAPDTARLRELYTRYELRSLLKQLEGGAATRSGAADSAASAGLGRVRRTGEVHCERRTAPPQETNTSSRAGSLPGAPLPLEGVERKYETITQWEDLERWIALLSKADLFAFDTETTSLDYMKAEIVGVSFGLERGIAAYVPLSHDYAGAPEQLDRDKVLAALKPILEDPERGKIGHHLKYDAHVLANHDIELAGMRFDTMLESYVLNSVASRHDMDSTAACYLGIKTIKFEDIAGKGAKQLTFNQIPVDKAAEYAAEDADVTLCLHRTLWPQLGEFPKLKKLYEELEQPLVPVLLRMEHRGVLVDRELLRAQSREFATQMLAADEAGAPGSGH